MLLAFITEYLILEGIDALGQETLLVDAEILTLARPPNVVWLGMWCCQQIQLLDDLY
jgi:hypothetical protein